MKQIWALWIVVALQGAAIIWLSKRDVKHAEFCEVAEIANAVDGNSEIEKRFSETDGEVAHLVAHGRAAENELQESAGALNADLENLSRELASKGISWHAKPFSAPMFAP